MTTVKKKLRVKVEPPLLLPNGIIHKGTTYKVSKGLDFEDVTKLVVNDVNDTVNLSEKKFILDISATQPLYLITRYEYADLNDLQREFSLIPLPSLDSGDIANFDNAKKAKDHIAMLSIIHKHTPDFVPREVFSSYSRISPLMGDQENVIISDVMITTPEITPEIIDDGSVDGLMVLNLSEFNIYSGAGNLESVTWVIKEFNGRVLDRRERDTHNLRSFALPDYLNKEDNFTVEAYYHSDTGAISFGGVYHNTNVSGFSGLFSVEQVGALVITRPQYFKMSLNTFNFDSFQLTIKDHTGKTIKQIVDVTDLAPGIDTDYMTFGVKYTFEFRMKLKNGVITEPVIVSDIASNDPRTYDENKPYLDLYDYKHLLMTNGSTFHLSYQLYNRSILLMLNNSRSMTLFKYLDDKLINVGDIVDLPIGNSVYNPDVFVDQLRNGKIVIAYVSRDSNLNNVVLISIYDFNPVSNKLNLENTFDTKVPDGLALSGSIATTWENDIYYIEEGDDDTPATLIKLNSATLDKTSYLLDNITANNNISLSRTLEDNLLILGGSLKEKSNKPTEFMTRSNDKIMLFDTKQSTFTELGTNAMSTVNRNLYMFHTVLRHNGDFTLFNNLNTNNTVDVDKQGTFIVDIKQKIVNQLTNDHDDKLPYVGTIVLLNGDVLRFTSLPQDPQKLYGYITNTMGAGDIDDNDSIAIDPNVLIAHRGENLTTKELARYDIVRSDDDGIINYVSNLGTTIIDNRTLVVTRDRRMDRDDYNAGNYEKYILCDGVQFILEG